MNNGTGRVWAVNANGGDEGRPNGVGPVYIENIDKIGGGVPDPSGASTGDVLTVDSQGNPAWEPPTGGGSSYTAGPGIEIENNQISVDTDVVATKSDLPDMSEYATESELTSGLEAKQDVISDLATIRSGASAGSTAVQPAALNDYATTTALTEGLATKQDTISDLSAIRSGAQAGSTAVQPAALNDYATTSALTSGLAAKQDTISDLSTIRTGASAGATAVQPGDLATVATTGNYADLSNKPSLATVATSGSYDDLSNKPSIPAAQVQTDWDAVSGIASIANKPNLATVATSGSYNDLSDKPSIPAAVTVDQHYDALSANPQSGTAVAEAIAGTGQVPTVTSADDNKVLMASYSGGVGSFAWEPSAAATQVNADWEASSGVAEILHKPDLSVYAQSANLATVATSGDYNDLSNRPTIPAAQVNADWNANSGVSQILNKPTLATVATSGDYADLQNKPTIPAAQVQSDWAAASGIASIANKPDLSVYATNSDLTSGLAAKQDTISDLSTIRSGAAAGATAVQPGSLATVATTGSYADLSNTPDLSVYATSSELTSGLASKQDTISDLSTIRSGATAGATAVQPAALDDYATTSALASGLATKQDTLTAGSNITISNGTISAVDTTYTAGANITIENGVISATDGDTRYSAGNGIDIDANNEISVDTTVIATKTDLASKQDTISDLSAIRSGASLGSTAVQPATLDDYATTSALTSGLAEKQDTISDLSTIRTGASAGATAVQPGDLATVAISGSYSDLTNKPTIPTVPDTKPVVAGSNITITEGTNDITISATDTTYSAGTGISISSGTISNSDPLPSHTSTESGKVLGVDSNGDLDWVASSSATVDQTYNASSTNAQSGTAVAQAIASIPSASYTAGDGIDITSGEISVAYNQNTLDVAAISTTASISSVMAWALNLRLPSDVASMISSLMTGGPSVTMTIPSDILINQRGSEDDAFLMFGTGSFPGVDDSITLKAPLAYSERTEEGISLDGQTVTLPVVDSTNWYIGSNVTPSSQFTAIAVMFGSADGSSVSIYGGEGFYSETGTLNPPLTFSQLGAPQLTVLDPIPSHSSGDSGKVLTVNSSGNAAWATPSVVPTAGNMLSTTNNVLNVTTTAGITDIQQVNALPAQPVATVLYLIPET